MVSDGVRRRRHDEIEDERTSCLGKAAGCDSLINRHRLGRLLWMRGCEERLRRHRRKEEEARGCAVAAVRSTSVVVSSTFHLVRRRRAGSQTDKQAAGASTGHAAAAVEPSSGPSGLANAGRRRMGPIRGWGQDSLTCSERRTTGGQWRVAGLFARVGGVTSNHARCGQLRPRRTTGASSARRKVKNRGAGDG